LTGTTLLISNGDENKNLTLAARNICGVTLTTSDSLNTYDVLRPDKLVFTKSAFEKVEARLTKE
jgi:ribosomal protein L4